MNAVQRPAAPLPVQVLGAAVLVQGQALFDLRFLVEQGIQVAKFNGYPAARLQGLCRAVGDACDAVGMSPERHGDVAKLPLLTKSYLDGPDTIDTAEAAELSGLSRRQVQRIAKGGLGRHAGRGWLFDRAWFIAYLKHKERQDN